jgi:hypothetical protein
MEESGAKDTVETAETVAALRLQVQELEAKHVAMSLIVRRVAEARMCRDMVTMVESCPHCSLKRGGAYGYSGHHDETCIVSQARHLGF